MKEHAVAAVAWKDVFGNLHASAALAEKASRDGLLSKKRTEIAELFSYYGGRFEREDWAWRLALNFDKLVDALKQHKLLT